MQSGVVSEGHELHPPGVLPPRTILHRGQVTRKNREIGARPALRLSGSGVPRILVSFEGLKALSHSQFADELSRRPTDDVPGDWCENLLFGRRTKASDTRLIVFCVNHTQAPLAPASFPLLP